MSDPLTAQKLMNKANADLKVGNAQSAAQNYRRAYEQNPQDIKPLVSYGFVMLRLGNAGEALRACLAVIQVDPENLDALKISSSAATQLRDWAALLQVAESWCAAYPGDAEANRSLAFAHFERGDAVKARDVYGAFVEVSPQSAENQSIYSRLCLAAFDYAGAEGALEKAHELAPPTAQSLYALARVKMFMGSLDEAESLCVEAIRENPKFPLSFAQYVTLRNGKVDGEITTQIKHLVSEVSLPPEHKASLCFSLGDVHHHHENYHDAMHAYDSGNAISNDIFTREGLAYRAASFELQRDCERRLFEEMALDNAYAPGPARPIFVMGMPRSGTTLVESILAAHPEVFGAGELGEMPVIHNAALRWSESNGGAALARLPVAQLQAWRDQYFKSYPETAGARFVVDKQPLNFRAVGLIKTLFPEAVLIHIRRNPVDTGFSIYKNDFGKAWPYATSLENIAHFYGEYARLISYWEGRMGEEFLLFQYEELIADFEPQVRRLLASCNLEWKDECLEFHRTRRAVATFSTTQVRQPIRKIITSASGQYGQSLKPLIDGLANTGVDLTTGARKA